MSLKSSHWGDQNGNSGKSAHWQSEVLDKFSLVGDAEDRRCEVTGGMPECHTGRALTTLPGMRH